MGRGLGVRGRAWVGCRGGCGSRLCCSDGRVVLIRLGHRARTRQGWVFVAPGNPGCLVPHADVGRGNPSGAYGWFPLHPPVLFPCVSKVFPCLAFAREILVRNGLFCFAVQDLGEFLTVIVKVVGELSVPIGAPVCRRRNCVMYDAGPGKAPTPARAPWRCCPAFAVPVAPPSTSIGSSAPCSFR